MGAKYRTEVTDHDAIESLRAQLSDRDKTIAELRTQVEEYRLADAVSRQTIAALESALDDNRDE